jgi:hypothetical protein
MTTKKTILAFVTILVLTALANFLIHAVLLHGVYQENANLMRSPQDGQAHAPFLLVGFLFFAVAFVWLYPHAGNGGAWPRHGLRYGVAVWLLASVSRYVIYYAIQPWPINTVVLQIVYEFVMMLVLGEALAFVASR